MCVTQGTRTNECRCAVGYLGEFVVIAGSFNYDANDNPTIGTAQVTFEVPQAGEASPTLGENLVDALTT